MALFEEFDPDTIGRVGGAPPAGLRVRPAAEVDAEDLAEIIAERDGGASDGYRERLLAEVRDFGEHPRHLLLTAVLGGRVVAFARVKDFTPPEGAPANCAPAGLYLSGVIVTPAARRRGVASALLRARLEWAAGRAPAVYTFASAQNRVSLHLLSRFGFHELTRDFFYPRVSFTGGVGVLLVCALDGGAPHWS